MATVREIVDNLNALVSDFKGKRIGGLKYDFEGFNSLHYAITDKVNGYLTQFGLRYDGYWWVAPIEKARFDASDSILRLFLPEYKADVGGNLVNKPGQIVEIKFRAAYEDKLDWPIGEYIHYLNHKLAVDRLEGLQATIKEKEIELQGHRQYAEELYALIESYEPFVLPLWQRTDI